MDTDWPERIVVGADASRESQAAIDRALVLAKRAGSSVVVVHAVGLLEEGRYRERPDLETLIAAARERTGCSAELDVSSLYEDGPAIGVLLRVAARVGGDLIVVGRRGFDRTVRPLGSTSTGVLDGAEVPVLVVTAV